jgi:hypothetical protein
MTNHPKIENTDKQKHRSKITNTHYSISNLLVLRDITHVHQLTVSVLEIPLRKKSTKCTTSLEPNMREIMIGCILGNEDLFV